MRLLGTSEDGVKIRYGRPAVVILLNDFAGAERKTWLRATPSWQ
jgi:hypothetical protein